MRWSLNGYRGGRRADRHSDSSDRQVSPTSPTHAQNVVEVINTETIGWCRARRSKSVKDPKGYRIHSLWKPPTSSTRAGEEARRSIPPTKRWTGIQLGNRPMGRVALIFDLPRVGPKGVCRRNRGACDLGDQHRLPTKVTRRNRSRRATRRKSPLRPYGKDRLRRLNLNRIRYRRSRSKRGEVVGSADRASRRISPTGIALTPDQSPIAAFTPPSATAGIPGALRRLRLDRRRRVDRLLLAGPLKTGGTRVGSAPSTPSPPPAPSTRS